MANFFSKIGDALTKVGNVFGYVVDPIGKFITDQVTGSSNVYGEIVGTLGVGAAAVLGAGALGIGGAAAGAAGAGVAAETGIGGAQAGAAAASEAASTSAFASIGALITQTAGFLKSVIDPIAGAVNSVTKVVNDINDGLIKPLVDPILKTYDTVNTLVTEIHRDLAGGLKGILQIPQDIANALNSIDSVMQRTVMALGAANTRAMQEVLVPALANAAMGPMAALGATLTDPVKRAQESIVDRPTINLPEDAGTGDYNKQVADAINWLQSSDNPLAWVTRNLMDFVLAAQYLSIQREPYVDLIREGVRRQNPTARLSPSDALQAYQRGLIDATNAYEEMSGAGLDQARIATLSALAETQPTLGQVINKHHREIITSEQALHQLAQLGYDPDEAKALMAAEAALPSPNQIVKYFLRGEVSEAGARELLKWQGYENDEATRLLGVALDPADPSALTENINREALAEAGIASRTLSSPPPSVLISAGRAFGQSPQKVEADWTNHWTLLPANLITAAYFKGLLNHTQLIGELRAAAVPEELHELWIEMQRPLIPSRTIPSMLVHDVIDENDAKVLLEQQGYSATDAERYIKYARATETAAPGAGEAALHGLSQSTILNLYAMGSIDRAATISLLERIGIGAEAAELAVQLSDLGAQADERAALIDLVVTEASLGVIDAAEAQNQLLAAGLNTAEVEKAMAKLLKATRSKVKTPSKSEYDRMYLAGIIAAGEYTDALINLGYSETAAGQLLAILDAERATQTGGP